MDTPITKRESSFPSCGGLRFGFSAFFSDGHQRIEPLERFIEHAFSFADVAPLLFSFLLLHYMNDSVFRNFPKLARRSAILFSCLFIHAPDPKRLDTCVRCRRSRCPEANGLSGQENVSRSKLNG
jgi:hypothetical protein